MYSGIFRTNSVGVLTLKQIMSYKPDTHPLGTESKMAVHCRKGLILTIFWKT